MSINKAYDKWAAIYDSNKNRTRDLESQAIREQLKGRKFESILEAGCGTGKNTVFLEEISARLTSVDFSEGMIELAKSKVKSQHVTFRTMDLTQEWNFSAGTFDLISFSLVLEHIRDLHHIFAQAAKCLRSGGLIYIGELHPFKQLAGSQARFEIDGQIELVDCFNHTFSEFFDAAKDNGFILTSVKEYSDQETEGELPRILSLIYKLH